MDTRRDRDEICPSSGLLSITGLALFSSTIPVVLQLHDLDYGVLLAGVHDVGLCFLHLLTVLLLSSQ